MDYIKGLCKDEKSNYDKINNYQGLLMVLKWESIYDK